MQDPHVEKLYYEIIFSEHTDYDKFPSFEEETNDFLMSIDGECAIFSMKKHFADEVEARKLVDDYLRWSIFTKRWETLIGIPIVSGELRYRFKKSDIINREPLSDDNATIKSKMDKQEALKIIRMIAEGEDPYKDEGRAKYLPEHNPKTLKALCTGIASLFPIDNEGNEAISSQPLILKKLIKSPIEDFFKKLEKDEILEALKKVDLKQSEAAEESLPLSVIVA